MKKQLIQFKFPDMTAKKYDQCWDELRKAGKANPTGRIYHVASQQGDNWVVIDVWESIEAFNKFGETLIPILNKLGVAVAKNPPTITPVYYELTGVDAVVTH